MKKILLFFIALICTTDVCYATVSASLYVHAPGYVCNNTIASTKIWTNEFSVENLANHKTDYFNRSFSYANGSLKSGSFRIYETNPESLGYYKSIPFDYTFELTEECPSVSIDITKKLVEFNIEVTIKDHVTSKLDIYDYEGKRIFYEKEYQGTYTFTGIYGYYTIQTDYGNIAVRPSLDSDDNIIFFEDDYYRISYQKIKIAEPYQPEVSIAKICYNELQEKIRVDVSYIEEEKSDDFANRIETNSEDDNSLCSSIPIVEEAIEETIEESKEEIINEPIIEDNTISEEIAFEDNEIKTDLTINEITNEDIKSIILTPITSKNTPKSLHKNLFSSISDIVEEESESNLIIEYNKPIKNEKISYQKASNTPLFIILFVTIIPLFITKIVKRVRKS
ncbi:MAG: hypothetical protein J5892_05325 [Bacilli bacterium]|nr:hypothetical protein [Bacilli bacterium]